MTPGRPHRLPKDRYVGERTAEFTACMWDREILFTADEWVLPNIGYLERAMSEFGCVIPAYCFMPDHLHVMFMGLGEASDARAAMAKFKHLSGLWMKRKKLIGWQPDFYDHVTRDNEDWRSHAMYILLNPVRAGLVVNLFDYPYLGSIGCDLQDVYFGF